MVTGMNTRSLLLGAAALLALSSTANAATDGWYLSLEAGANQIEDWDQTFFTTNGAGVLFDTNPASASFDTGWAILGAFGYGFGGGWRAEVEAGYRVNEGDTMTVNGAPAPTRSTDLSEFSVMANVLYDIPMTDRLSFTLGAGAGGDYAMYDFNTPARTLQDENWHLAYQGIAGLDYAISPRTSLFLNYRYFRVNDPNYDPRQPAPSAFLTYFEGEDIVKHTATFGIRYALQGAAAEPVVAPPPPPPPPPPEPMAPKEFIVFFGHNKSDLTPEAMDVVRQAAAAAKQYGSATITVIGHADRSGSTAYNEKLSLKRGNTVKNALVGEGVSAGAISVSGKGEGDPMVPTADGVREPQNRRVHINL